MPAGEGTRVEGDGTGTAAIQMACRLRGHTGNPRLPGRAAATAGWVLDNRRADFRPHRAGNADQQAAAPSTAAPAAMQAAPGRSASDSGSCLRWRRRIQPTNRPDCGKGTLIGHSRSSGVATACPDRPADPPGRTGEPREAPADEGLTGVTTPITAWKKGLQPKGPSHRDPATPRTTPMAQQPGRPGQSRSPAVPLEQPPNLQ